MLHVHGPDRFSKASALVVDWQHSTPSSRHTRQPLRSRRSKAAASSSGYQPPLTAPTSCYDTADGTKQSQTRRVTLVTLGAAAALVTGSRQASGSTAANPTSQVPASSGGSQSTAALEAFLEPGPHATIAERVQLPWPRSVPGATADSIPVIIVRPADVPAQQTSLSSSSSSSSSASSGIPSASGFAEQAAAAPQQPLVIFCPGFLVDVQAYSSYYGHLASWGFVVAAFSLPGDTALDPIPDTAAAQVVASLLRSVAAGGDSDSDSDSDNDSKEPVQSAEDGGQNTQIQQTITNPGDAGTPLMANNVSSSSSSGSDTQPPDVSQRQQPPSTAVDAVQQAQAANIVASADSAGIQQQQQLSRNAKEEVPQLVTGDAAVVGLESSSLDTTSSSGGSGNGDTATAALVGGGNNGAPAIVSVSGEVAAAQEEAGPAGDGTARPAEYSADQAAALQAAAAAAQGAGVVLLGHSRGAKLALLAAAALATCSSDSDSDDEDIEGGTKGQPSSASDVQARASTGTADEVDGEDDDGSSSDEEEECAQVVGLGLIDPVDLTYDAPPGSPSALPALQEVLQGPAPPKLLLVGAGLNSDCIPRRSNYSTFAAAATAAQGGSSGAGPAVQASPAGVVADGSRSGSMLVVLQQVGHLQFLATQTALQRSACRQGKVDEEVLRRMVAALLAWSFTPGSQGVGSPPGSSQQGEQQEGRMDGVQAAEGPHKALPGWLVEDAQNIQQVADGVGVAAEARAL